MSTTLIPVFFYDCDIEIAEVQEASNPDYFDLVGLPLGVLPAGRLYEIQEEPGWFEYRMGRTDSPPAAFLKFREAGAPS